MLRNRKGSAPMDNGSTMYQVGSSYFKCFHDPLYFVLLIWSMRGPLGDGMDIEVIGFEVRISRSSEVRLSALFIPLYSERDGPSVITQIYPVSETVPQRRRPSLIAKDPPTGAISKQDRRIWSSD